jgi:nucleotide-binding universal stress UspA family protein
MLKTR